MSEEQQDQDRYKTDGADAELEDRPEIEPELAAILDILHSITGHDFRCYKPTTLGRRIRRRMILAKIPTLPGYARFLEAHPDEIRLLQKDLFIGVTEFFRQPQAWEVLENKVIAPLVAKSPPDSEIRIWIPGCSTGKEVYSLAMLFNEQTGKCGKEIRLQIFATDSDTSALETARAGSYTEEELGENVSSERRNRFFTRQDGRWQIAKGIRTQVVFAPQNLTTDPPFSRIDLVICRNLLIYLDKQAQKKVIEIFHFALREGGFLFLGGSETIGDREDLFEPVSKKWRIYRRIGARRFGIEIPVRPVGEAQQTAGRIVPGYSPRMNIATTARQVLLDRFTPACVMIDRKLHVLYVHGPVENYLTFPPGELTTCVADMAREGLKARLRGAVTTCMENNRPVSFTARVRRGGKSIPVKAAVSPLNHPREADGLLLITFEDYRTPASKARGNASTGTDAQRLENELKVTREELRSTIEQLECSTHLFKVSNEEVTAANEELQSANEELETSKEELLSFNEELNTINANLQDKVGELESTNNDVVNLLASTHIATVFLDKELRVRRYTPAITPLMSLIPSDVGRPVADVLRRFTDEALLADAARVLAHLSPVAKEIQADDGRWFIRQVTPYRTRDDRIEGVVITFLDITDLKHSGEALREAKENLESRVRERTAELVTANRSLIKEMAERKRAELIVDAERKRFNDVLETIPAYLILLTPDYHVPFANRFFRERFGESNGRRCFEYLFERSEPCEICETYTVLKTMEPHEWEWTGPDGRDYYVHDFPFTDIDGSTLIMEMGIDITDLKRAQEELRRHKEHLEELVGERTSELETQNARLAAEIMERKKAEEQIKSVALFPDENPFPILRASGDGTLTYANRASAALLEHWGRRVGEPVPGPVGEKLTAALAGGCLHEMEIRCGARDILLALMPLVDRGYVNFYGRDITERKMMEEILRQSEEDLNRAQAVAHIGSWRLDVRADKLHWSDETYRMFGIPKGTPLTYEAFLERVHPRDRDCVNKEWTAAVLGAPYDIVHRIVVGDTMKWVREQAELEFDPGGGLLGGFGTVQDITRRKEADAELEKSLRRFELLSRTAADLLRTADPQEMVETLCRKVMEFLDCQLFFNFLAAKESGRLRLNACAGIPDGEAQKLEWLDYGEAVCGCVARDGCRIVAEHIRTTPDPRTDLVRSYGVDAYACHPLLGADGGVIGTLSFGTRTREIFNPDELSLMKAVADQVAVAMTRIQWEQALRDSEEALRQANEDLERKVRERTGDLTDTVITLRSEIKQRLRAEKELKSANRKLKNQAKQLRVLAGELTMAEQRERRRMAGILHDHLQQQLAVAKMQVSCLSPSEMEIDFYHSTAKIEELLADAIRVSRSLTAELSPPILHEVGLEAALEWLARWMADKHGLTVVLSMEENIPSPEEDVKIFLFEATRELLFNAIKHAEVDNVDIGLRLIGGCKLGITVSDAGRGFDPAGLKPAGEIGAGYGLFSIRERLLLIDGKLEIDSTPGEGSRFTMTVPILSAASEPPAALADAIATPGREDGEPPAECSAIRILIVDDHAMMREGLAGMLSQEPDMEIAGEAKNGHEAIEMAGALRPDVILMDVSMPGLNGIEATRAVHARFPDIRIIGLSMFEEGERTQAIRDAGAVGYVTKSGPKAGLIAAIRAAMGNG